MNAGKMVTFLCKGSGRCRRVRVTPQKKRWACGLPEGHKGKCARIKLELYYFDEDGAKGSLKIDTMQSVEDWNRHFARSA